MIGHQLIYDCRRKNLNIFMIYIYMFCCCSAEIGGGNAFRLHRCHLFIRLVFDLWLQKKRVKNITQNKIK